MHAPIEFVDTTSLMFLKLVISMLLGGVVGTERAILAKQAAGTRTFGLVSLGACLFVLVGMYVDNAYIGILNFDPTHITAAVVTGIGFIGAGLIIFRNDALHGVTTAAGLWMAAAIGVSVAFGLYHVAIFATLLVLIMFTGMWYVENKFKHWFTDHQGDHVRSS